MGCALAAGVAPEIASISPQINADRLFSVFKEKSEILFSVLLEGTIGLPDVLKTILALQGSRGLKMCPCRSFFVTA